ncbi:thioredoxin family protein [Ruminococcus sp.]|uniref:thioredoxin family protein n=1 Tax=Ruminococcus sp. TaxID=41978 RepID=UPI003FD7C7F6
MLTELTNQNYNELIATDKPLVIEFYSPTCAHCKRTEAGLKEAVEELGEIAVIAKCDITAQPDLAQRYDVTALPTLLFIKDGDIKNKLEGFTHKLIILDNIKRL